MASFLAQSTNAAAEGLYDKDRSEIGFVMNASRLWAYQPAIETGIFDLLRAARDGGGLSMRQCGILVTATASALGDSYCSLAWGMKLSNEAEPAVAASVLRGDDAELTPAEAAMAVWARQVVRDPNGTTESDVQTLRDAGYSDDEIFAMTVFVALRLAFSTVNDALGATPDHELGALVPGVVQDVVTYGRSMDSEPV